jgi:hypothetical protein
VSQRHEFAGIVTLEVHKTPCPSSILGPVPSGVLTISRVVNVAEQRARTGHGEVTELHRKSPAGQCSVVR